MKKTNSARFSFRWCGTQVVFVVILFLPLFSCKSIDGVDWQDDVTSVKLKQNSEQEDVDMYRNVDDEKMNGQDLLYEIMKLASSNSPENSAQENTLTSENEKKYRIIVPYFMKNNIPTPPKRGINVPYFMKREHSVNVPYFMKKREGGVFVPYFMKRDEDGVNLPYFMKKKSGKAINVPYFMKRDDDEASDAGKNDASFHTNELVLGESKQNNEDDEKRFFGHMTSFDLDNYLALQGAAKQYTRQLWDNEHRMLMEGK